MFYRIRVWVSIPLVVLLLLYAPGTVFAGETTLGVTINGTTGHHIEANGTQIVPFVPVPIFKIEHQRKRFGMRVEVMPPIGPVALGQGNQFGPAWAPRVSFLSADALYTLPTQRFSFGVGETVVNQRTFYGDTGVIQASRVVGARVVLQSLLYATPFGQLQANLALNPSMHGVQYTMLPPGAYFFGPNGQHLAQREVSDGEVGSLVDGVLRWSVPSRRGTFAYGLRYLNYTAAYTSSGRLADHNHLLMPFIGVDVHLNRSRRIEVPGVSDPPPITVLPYRDPAHGQTRFALSLLGTSGSHGGTFNDPSVTPFGLAPLFELSHRGGQLEGHLEGILPASRANPFGPENVAWSYLDGGLRFFSRSNRYAIGVSDTSINQHAIQVPPNHYSRSHHEGLRYSLTFVPFATMQQKFEISAAVIPYLHDSTYNTAMVVAPGTQFCPTCPPPKYVSHTFTNSRPGSLVDMSLKWSITQRKYDFTYGIRYMNQTLNLASRFLPPGATGPNAILQHDTAFMPFLGITAVLGRKP